MPKIRAINTGPLYARNPASVHGRNRKDMVVLHETQSPDIRGVKDIAEVERYLVGIDFGIHGMTDKEGNTAWAYGFGNAVLYHAGGVNERAIGIEQVARPPEDSPKSRPYWKTRSTQLKATAKLLAAISRNFNIPLRYSAGDTSGITTHWNISQIYPASQGHWDCHPIHFGGYFPVLYVIQMARIYRAGKLRLL